MLKSRNCRQQSPLKKDHECTRTLGALTTAVSHAIRHGDINDVIVVGLTAVFVLQPSSLKRHSRLWARPLTSIISMETLSLRSLSVFSGGTTSGIRYSHLLSWFLNRVWLCYTNASHGINKHTHLSINFGDVLRWAKDVACTSHNGVTFGVYGTL